ncbi:MAG: DUF2442 domain-containing protein [Actinomycetota bacterium]
MRNEATLSSDRAAAVKHGVEDEIIYGAEPLPHVLKADVVADFVLRLEFDDGFVGQLDLEPHLTGPIFEPLRDPHLFGQVRVDPEIGTVVWPNGADLAPEFLRKEAS